MKTNILKGMLAAALLLMLGLGACEKRTYESIQAVDTQKITTFISQNNLNMKLSDSGYYYQVVQNGNGKLLDYSDSIAYFMTVKSLSGSTLYQSNMYGASESLLGYASPFLEVQQTLRGLNNGGAVRVILPSHMAFGLPGSASFGVGPNENLDIQVKTVNITNRPTYEDSLIKKYISDKGITGMVKNADGIYVKINTKGMTDTVINSVESTVTFSYNLRTLGFDTNIESSTIVNPLSSLIKGWQSVLVGEGKNVSLRCIIPSRLGYGSGVSPKTGLSSLTGIPANAILDFDITVLNIVNSTQSTQ